MDGVIQAGVQLEVCHHSLNNGRADGSQAVGDSMRCGWKAKDVVVGEGEGSEDVHEWVWGVYRGCDAADNRGN